MNFIKKNAKHILMGVTLSFFVLILGLGLGLSAFGMGMESQRFITSVEKTIDKYIPKGEVVVSAEGKLPLIYNLAVGNLKNSYKDDVLSTLTVEQKSDETIKMFWENYANAKFDERWKSTVDNKADIDINEFSHALVQFDIEIAKEFHYAFAHSGLAWIGQRKTLSSLWSSNFANTSLYQEAQQNETVLEQSKYVTGTYIVNNKVGFINNQIKQILNPVNLNAFKDQESVKNALMRDDNGTQVPVQISVNELYHPNYTTMFQQTRIGSIFLIILTPIFGIVFITSSLIRYSVFLKMNWSKNLLNKMKINKVRV